MKHHKESGPVYDLSWLNTICVFAVWIKLCFSVFSFIMLPVISKKHKLPAFSQEKPALKMIHSVSFIVFSVCSDIKLCLSAEAPVEAAAQRAALLGFRVKHKLFVSVKNDLYVGFLILHRL